MSATLRKILWGLAGIVALLLSVATINLMTTKTVSDDLIGSRVYIAGSEQLVLLRAAPRKSAQVTAILGIGTSVKITELDTEGTSVWLFVESNDGSGWVEAENLSEEMP